MMTLTKNIYWLNYSKQKCAETTKQTNNRVIAIRRHRHFVRHSTQVVKHRTSS